MAVKSAAKPPVAWIRGIFRDLPAMCVSLHGPQTRGGKSVKRFDWIDALRGYAIIGVVITHLGLLGPPAPVQLFFLASGIALMYSYESHGSSGANQFYVRRFFRIAPMFWASIPIFYVTDLIRAEPTADIAQIVSAVTFTHWLKPQWNNSAVPGSWSIACEVLFYLFFPFVAARVANIRQGIGLVVASVALAACLWPILVLYADWMGVADIRRQHSFAFYSFSTQAPCFAIGIVVFRLLDKKRPNGLTVGLFGAVAIVALWWLFPPEHRDRPFLVSTAAYGAIAYALGNGKLGILVTRPICWIGLVSYSAYFWHFVVINLSGYLPGVGGIERTVLVIPAVTLALSTLTYLAVERPMMRVGARLASATTRPPPGPSNQMKVAG